MTTTFASLRSDIRLLLDDPDAEKYTDLQIEECLALALADYSLFKPLNRTYVLDSNGSRRLTLPADFVARAITNVEWQSDAADFSDAVDFYASQEDEQWVLELPGPTIPSGEILIVVYESLHTIDGHEGAAGTSVPDQDVAMLALGAAGYAGLARAISKVEGNNLNPQEAKDLGSLARQQIEAFHAFFGKIPSYPFRTASWHDRGMDKNF